MISMKNKVKYLDPLSPEKWPEKLKNNKFQLFLDYDGTLAPFNENPDKAYPIDETNQVIRDYLKNNIPVAIVTGRNALDIRNKFIKPIVPVIGLHGREFLPAEQDEPIKIGPEVKTIPDKLLKKIIEINENYPVKLEQKNNSYAIHIKNNSNLQEIIYHTLNKILINQNFNDNWEFISGRKVIELRPADWNKGNAVKKYRDSDIMAIYIGDDRTDEDVFEILSEPCINIYVKNEDKKLDTKANFYLDSPADVINFLKILMDTHL